MTRGCGQGDLSLHAGARANRKCGCTHDQHSSKTKCVQSRDVSGSHRPGICHGGVDRGWVVAALLGACGEKLCDHQRDVRNGCGHDGMKLRFETAHRPGFLSALRGCTFIGEVNHQSFGSRHARGAESAGLGA